MLTTLCSRNYMKAKAELWKGREKFKIRSLPLPVENNRRDLPTPPHSLSLEHLP